MLKLLTVILLSCCSFTVSAQKKKAPAAPKNSKRIMGTSFSTTAELFSTKAGSAFYLIAGPAQDTLFLRQFEPKSVEPTETTITEFTSKGTKLISVSWKEVAVTKSNNKTENGITVQTKIFNPATKAVVFENNQCTVNISEIVSLSGTEATKTVEKIRRDGCECRISQDGDVTLTSKTRNDRLVYDPKEGKYVSAPKKK